MEQDLPAPESVSSSLEDLIPSLAEHFATHPGFMWQAVGFEGLHADWPAYPLGHGVHAALRTLTEFPVGTSFYPLDGIDCCTLFVVGRRPAKDAFASHHLHIAVWDDDLRECSARGYVRGAEDGSVVLTREGAHVALITELTAGVHEDLLSKIEDHLYDRRYDTAVREAAIRVELALRTASGSAAHGLALIEQCFRENSALVPRHLSNADRLALRSAFRSYFVYVRNEYAHNIPQTDLLTACRLVRRSSDLLRAVEILVRAVRPA